MRVQPYTASVGLLLLAGLMARAENTPYEATVTVPEVEVRCGPSSDPKMYPTSKLRQGDKVTVLKEEEGGWLAIKPPPGSFSWINTRFLELNTGQTTGRVLGDDVPVRIGSELRNEPPTVEARNRLKRGAQVVVLDTKKAYADDGGWLPIAPTPEEVRYLPADAVKGTPRVQTVNSAPPEATPAVNAAAPAVGSTPISPSADDTTLWQQAQNAERAGNIAEAADMYLLLARRTHDHNLSMRCHNRVFFLRQGQRAAPPQGYQARQSDTATFNGYPQQQAVPQPAYNQPQFQPASRVRSDYNNAVPTQPAANAALRSSGAGRLEKAPFLLNNQPAYVLVSSQGLPRLYVSAQPGVNLEPYVYRNVELIGPVVYRGDLRSNYMTAQQIRPLP
ncbi:MAG: SH3 domain-containing protein [Gemmataceae bacterium]